MSAESVASYFPPGISITGGVPVKSQDLAASIIFAVAYAILLPLVVFRWVRSSSRCMVLIRPTVFVPIRVATFAIRAYMSDGHYSEGLFIAEQILLLCGFVLLCSAAVGLLGSHMVRTWAPTGGPVPLIHKVHKLLEVALLVAIALGLYSGTQLSNVSSASQSKINTIKDCRDANVIICIVISLGVSLLSFYSYVQQQGRAPMFATFYLAVIGGLLALGSIYKLVTYYHSPNVLHTGTKVAFYCLSSLPEILATTMFFAINLNDAYEIQDANQKQKDNKKMQKGQYQGAGYTSQGQSLRNGTMQGWDEAGKVGV